MAKNSGTIPLKDGFVFVWLRAKDGEIHGGVEYPKGGIVPNLSGWYRTENENEAAKLAQQCLDRKKNES